MESIVKAIEEEEKKRSEVKEVKLKESPSHRSNLSMIPHPEVARLCFGTRDWLSAPDSQFDNVVR